MSTIKVSCIDQALAFENTPLITSGGMDENFVTFTFCSKWDGFEKTAVFWRNEADAYHVRLDGVNTCQIPPEVTTDEGTIFFGVFGVNAASKQRTSAVLTYRVEKGVITLGTAPSDPTPDIYTQIMAEVSTTKNLVQETRDAEREFEARMIAEQELFMEQTHREQQRFEAEASDQFRQYKDEVADAAAAGLVPDGTITTARLANGAVTAAKLNADAVAHVLAQGIQFFSGSYTGNGTHGSGNKKTLTFNFDPRLVIVCSDHFDQLMFIKPSTVNVFATGSEEGVSVSWGTKSVSWYATSGSPAQLNENGKTYYYVAFG